MSMQNGIGGGAAASMIDELDRHYRFTVDLKSTKDFTFSISNLYFKYTYVPFGGNTPVYTRPPLHIKGNVFLLLTNFF